MEAKPLTIDEYQVQAYSTAVYPEAVKCVYPAIGFLGELGEVANKYKKVLRGDIAMIDATPAILDELGDCLWYIAGICTDANYKLSVAVDYEHFSEVTCYSEDPAILLRSLASTATQLFDKENRGAVRRALYLLAAFIFSLGSTLEDVANDNLAKLQKRKAAATLQGSGDGR